MTNGLYGHENTDYFFVAHDKMKEYLMSKNIPETKVFATGKNPKMKIAFEEIVLNYNKQNSIKVLEYTNKVPELMCISDLVVSKPGGLTTSESLASGLPMVIINPIPGQEEENAEFLQSKNIGIWIRKHYSSYEILDSLLSNPDKLEQMKINTKLLAKKYSTDDICKIILYN